MLVVTPNLTAILQTEGSMSVFAATLRTLPSKLSQNGYGRTFIFIIIFFVLEVEPWNIPDSNLHWESPTLHKYAKQ